MYQLDWVKLKQVRPRSILKLVWDRELTVSATVWKLGFTSLLTDISSEMVASILPLYFIYYLHLSPLQFGLLDGISQGAAIALLSLASGILADRWRRQKEIATAGYAFSALSRVGLLAASTAWGWIAGILVLDRVGKGIRTAPRDAMISLSSARERLATSFAVHRGLDACGAVGGPLVAFLVLRMIPNAFNVVLMTSFCVALMGLGVIALLVDRPPETSAAVTARPSFRVSLDLLRQPRFRALNIAGALLGLATASDGFIYLVLQKNTNSPATSIPFYAFLTAAFYVVLSVPAGRVADRLGRRKVFLGGYALFAAIYAVLLFSNPGPRTPMVVVGLLGIYYAMTDGVLAAMASATLGPQLRTSGLALLNTVTSLSRLVSSVIFGWMWTAGTMNRAVWVFFLGLFVAIIVSAGILAVNTKAGD